MINIDIKTLIDIVEGLIDDSDILKNKDISGFSIDTRSIKKGEIYIAIKGKNFDGHSFIDEAFKNGATLCIISEKIKSSKNCIKVKDTQQALAQISKFFLEKVKPKVIAITGSNGKTTAKELILKILKNKYKEKYILGTAGNFNNHIGLPLTLLKLNKEHKIVILEMGMNHPGEINYLSKIAPPDISIITNIGEAHIENFDSRRDIALAKKELLINTKIDGKIILPLNDKFFELLSEGLTQEIISFGANSSADINCSRENDLYTFYYDKKEIVKNIKFIVEHNAIIFMSAIVVAIELGFEQDDFDKIKKIDITLPQRLEFKRSNSGIKIIDDSYNANPSSMKKAVDILNDMQGHKIALLGDMSELGKNSLKYHQDIISDMESKNIDLIFTIGNFFKKFENTKENIFWFKTKKLLIESLKKHLKSNTIILVKGSRSMKMEEIVEVIKQY